jgi:periplasmic protein CpxP/Spy
MLFLAQLPAHNFVHRCRQIASYKETSMLKHYLLIVLAAGAISIAAPFATAQDNSAPPAPSANDQQAPSQGRGRWGHGAPDPAQQTAHLSKKLNLTSDQQTKVLSIFQSEHAQMESLRSDSSLSQQDRHTKMRSIHETTNTQVRALLDSNQQKTWDTMQANREEHMQNRHQGGDQASPPPQQ